MADRLILASGSPRRQELLKNAGFQFEARPSTLPETRQEGEDAEAFVRRMARAKALDVARSCAEGSVVLGADTVVVAGDEVLGKPSGPEDAARMLRMLSGTTHRVLTGVCSVGAPDQVRQISCEATQVTFRSLDEDEIGAYVRSGEPLDKAGAYGIQGLASKFVMRIEGCYFNVMGLPVSTVYGMLKDWYSRG